MPSGDVLAVGGQDDFHLPFVDHPILQRRWYLNVPVTPRYLASVIS